MRSSKRSRANGSLTAIRCPATTAKSIGAVRVPIIRVVFSAFGNLFTVLFAEDLDQATVDETVSVVTSAGFTFVPADELEEPYTGSNPRLTGMTWFTRFFCYL